MSSSIVIDYQGKRKTIKVTPNTLVIQIIKDICSEYNINSTRYCLKHKKSILNNSDSYRFCNLSNNAVVELVQLHSIPESPKLRQCRIAISVEGGLQLNNNFDAEKSLYQVVMYFISEGLIAQEVMLLSPEIIYLRSRFIGEDALRNTTLASLGLAGQSAKLQLRWNNDKVAEAQAAALVQVMVDNNTGSKIESSTVDNTETTITQTAIDDTNVPAVVTTDQPVVSAMDICDADNNNTVPTEKNSQNNINNGTEAEEEPSVTNTTNTTQQETPSSTNIYDTDATTTTTLSFNMSPEYCIEELLKSNFDAVSSPAIITLTKYLRNILKAPYEKKYRILNTQNKIFQDKIIPVKYSIEFLFSLGFRSNNNNFNNLVMNNKRFEYNGNIISLLLSDEDLNIMLLKKGWLLLHQTMDTLEVPLDVRPSKELPASASTSTSAKSSNNDNFDPFKANIVRNAAQPPRMESETDKQLALLQKRRNELEGNKDEVARLTTVLFPNSDGSMISVQEYEKQNTSQQVTSNDNDTEDAVDNSGVQKAIMQKILNTNKEDSAPLTTKAYRDLQKAQKERVYKQTLIRIKFPDKVCLQGYFHPRHTILDVYDWVKSNLQTLPKDDSTTTVDNNYVPWELFELYTSPPRCVLNPIINKNNESPSMTLFDQKLVPAAVIYLTWKEKHPFYNELIKWGLLTPNSTATTTTTTTNNTLLGLYLLQELLMKSDEKMKNNNNNDNKSQLYPSSQSLVTNTYSNNTGNNKSIFDKLLGKGESTKADDKTTKNSKKPKWFKL